MRSLSIAIVAALLVPLAAQAGQPLNLAAAALDIPQSAKARGVVKFVTPHSDVYQTLLPNKAILPWRKVAAEVGKLAPGCNFRFDLANKVFWIQRDVNSDLHKIAVRAHLTPTQFMDNDVQQAACKGEITIAN